MWRRRVQSGESRRHQWMLRGAMIIRLGVAQVSGRRLDLEPGAGVNQVQSREPVRLWGERDEVHQVFDTETTAAQLEYAAGVSASHVNN